ncbi:alpha-1,3-mannosyl-glycoprotein 4-beta-N-acetylglucosaminyltransferase A [Elysia marginata]|uniref:Alpha-1,3-mannosyl-glycoprotein 4-beta-N-acetylglucosaminyltransferase A n=1 Tax=Elysia marginata TaxID=1093978 RepID=A0AAV4ETL9_9GAST|nr:alpha-1,3-mannosyl-glycoprotein 4-beta-N-acetylglucosaminyltransferase A [Elysia marginata]
MASSNTGKYIDIALLTAIGVLTSIIMQMSMYLIGAMTCEYFGLQAENTFCQIYFSVEFEESMKMNNISRAKRWCLIWKNGLDGERGMRCMRSDSLLALYKGREKPTPDAKNKEVKGTTAVYTNAAKTPLKPKPTMPALNLLEVRMYLPLIELKVKSLTPKIWITRNRQSVDVVMALSIYKLLDKDGKELFTTLDALFFNIPSPGQHKYLVMVFITEILDDTYVENLVSDMMIRYNVQIETGLMEIIVPRDNFYISMFKPKYGFSQTNNLSEDKKKKRRNRRKQCMDHIYMMLLSHQRGKYYLQLGHNVVTRQGFLTILNRAMAKHESENWSVMYFSPVGIIGKLMHSSDLIDVTKYLSRIDMNKPADFHVESFVKDKTCQDTQTDCGESNPRPFVQSKEILFQYVKSNSSIHARSKDGDEQKDAIKTLNSMWISPPLKSKNIGGYIPCTTIRLTSDILPLLAPGAPFLSMFSHIGNFNAQGDFDVTFERDSRQVQVVEITLGSGSENHDIFLREIQLAMNCKQSTRLYISSTAEIEPSNAPSWFVSPSKHLPRKEEEVLVSY